MDRLVIVQRPSSYDEGESSSNYRNNNNNNNDNDNNNNYYEYSNNNNNNTNGIRFAPMEMEPFQPIQVVRNNNSMKSSSTSTISSSFYQLQRQVRLRNRRSSVSCDGTGGGSSSRSGTGNSGSNSGGIGRRGVHPLDECMIMIRLHFEYYPKVSCFIITTILCCCLYTFIVYIRQPIIRNRLSHDYTKMNVHYSWKASEVKHWCLWGGNDDCICDDFTDPISRIEFRGWLETHEMNKKRILVGNQLSKNNPMYDVIFYGDELIEAWNGRWLNMPLLRSSSSSYSYSRNNNILESNQTEGQLIQTYWNTTFTKHGGGDLDGLALGIKGDTAPNLLWRLQNGEMPMGLQSKVFWLLIGTNDLEIGGCSEEAVLLGILRLVDEINYHHPHSVIVIQGILPRSSIHEGGMLPHLQEPTTTTTTTTTISNVVDPLVHHHHHKKRHHSSSNIERAHTVEEAKDRYSLWPSIQNINQQLAAFCAVHDHLVYFDADAIFLGNTGNEHYQQNKKVIITDLMPDMVHPSYDGYRIMGDVIRKELKRIINDGNESNIVETGRSQV